MRARRYFAAVDSHTEGMPTRVITGGLGAQPGDTMQERRLYFETHLDDLRLLLMREPRGHAAMSGAFLQPPTRPDADWGVLFVEVSGCLPMCGHGTIGVATVLVECGLVTVTEPETVIHLDTPAGLVQATVSVRDGRAERVARRQLLRARRSGDRRARANPRSPPAADRLRTGDPAHDRAVGAAPASARPLDQRL
jgi:proline racemase